MIEKEIVVKVAKTVGKLAITAGIFLWEEHEKKEQVRKMVEEILKNK